MKNIISLLVAIVFFSTATFAQNEDVWEERGERIAKKAERLADRAERLATRVERQAERTATNWEIRAERIAEDFERTFDREWNVRVNGDGPEEIFVGDLGQAYLGIHSDDISKEKARKLGFRNIYGSYVTRVVAGSGAAEAGLQPFDYIYGVEDQRTSNNQDLTDILADYEPGDEVTLHFVRNGDEMTAQAILGEHNDFEWRSESGEHPFLGISPHEDEDDDDLDGVTVEVISNTTASGMGLQDGDVITQVNGRPILDWDDVGTAIDNMEPGAVIQVVYERDGNEMSAEAPIKSKSYENESVVISENGWDWNWGWDGDDEDEIWDENGAFLGIYSEKISEKKARKLGFDNPYGSYVTGILKNTAAEKAGLQPFDYIFGIDEYRVGRNQSLGGILRKYEPGDEVTVHIYRKGAKQNVNLTLGSHGDAEKVKRNRCEDPFFGIIQVHKDSDVDGVKIKPVSNSTAKSIGLEANDIITFINGYPMLDWTDITTGIEMLSPGESIKVEYLRDGSKMTASGKITSYAEAKNCEDCDCDEYEKIVIDIDPDFDFSFGGDEEEVNLNRRSRLNFDDLNLNLGDLSASEASDMQRRGIDMSVENSLQVNNLDISPNSDIGMFELEFDLPSEGETIVKVYNSNGRTIYEYDLGRFSGDFSDNIDISQNGPGTYFLHITQGEKAFSRKIELKND